jgi:hypothetical protein
MKSVETPGGCSETPERVTNCFSNSTNSHIPLEQFP